MHCVEGLRLLCIGRFAARCIDPRFFLLMILIPNFDNLVRNSTEYQGHMNIGICNIHIYIHMPIPFYKFIRVYMFMNMNILTETPDGGRNRADQRKLIPAMQVCWLAGKYSICSRTVFTLSSTSSGSLSLQCCASICAAALFFLVLNSRPHWECSRDK